MGQDHYGKAGFLGFPDMDVTDTPDAFVLPSSRRCGHNKHFHVSINLSNLSVILNTLRHIIAVSLS